MTDITARLHFYLKDEGNDSRSEAYQLIKLSLAEINRQANQLMIIRNALDTVQTAVDDGERRYPPEWSIGGVR